MDQQPPAEHRPERHWPAGGGLALGIGVGVALGGAFNNIALGIAIGAAIGVVLDQSNARRNRQDP
jgi:F0F1-type ATP synthase membrane subunit c/vacuolar-type H+-ATPase subunit K